MARSCWERSKRCSAKPRNASRCSIFASGSTGWRDGYNDDIVVKVADFRVGCAGDVLVTYGLGSCVAVVLHDPKMQVGGLAHILLPTPSLGKTLVPTPANFPSQRFPAMLAEMAEFGASPRRITARLIGGASMFAILTSSTIQMGERNIWYPPKRHSEFIEYR